MNLKKDGLGPEGFTQSTEDSPQEKCSLCGNTFSQDMMIQFSGKWVCAHCKPNYLQMLQQGLTPAAHMRYGGFWIRLGAKVIDGIILQVVNFIIFTLGSLFIVSALATKDPSQLIVTTVIQLIIGLFLAISYEVWFVGKFRATPGKMMCGLAIVDPVGGRISYLRALGRYLATILSSIILCVGFIMAGFDREKRALHDRICDTRVIRK
jgi:uncharacterized RDD family membrane protein YckC